MRRLNGVVTALLIILSLGGLLLMARFLRNESQMETARQEKMKELTEALQPINASRKELQEQEEQWQKKLEDEQNGKSCVMLCFNTMDSDLYDTVFDLMEQYGLRGNFVLKDGKLPGYSTEDLSAEQMSEMLESGWEYALGISTDVEKESEEDETLSALRQEEENQEEENQEGEDTQEAAEGAEAQEEPVSMTGDTWLAQVDAYLATVDGSSWSRPATMVCTQEQYESINKSQLADRGFSMACVLNTERFPVVGKLRTMLKLSSGVYTQQDQIQEDLESAVASNASMVITINDVLQMSQDAGYDLALTKFTTMLNYLKEGQDGGDLYVLTFSEYYQYQMMQKEAYDSLQAEYKAFKKEMQQQLQELDEQEAEIVASLDVEETEGTSGWKLW